MSDLGSHDNDVAYTVLEHQAAADDRSHVAERPRAASRTRPRDDEGDVRVPGVAIGSGPGEARLAPGRQQTAGWVPEWGGRSQVFVGEHGMLLGNGKLLPEETFKDFQPPPETLPRSPGHWVEWVNYAKGVGPVPGSNFQYSGWTTEANHLGNVAYRTGKKIEWDYVNLRARNAPEAAPFIKRPSTARAGRTS